MQTNLPLHKRSDFNISDKKKILETIKSNIQQEKKPGESENDNIEKKSTQGFSFGFETRDRYELLCKGRVD